MSSSEGQFDAADRLPYDDCEKTPAPLTHPLTQ